MSNVTAERFSKPNCYRKRRNSNAFSTIVYNSINPENRDYGIPVISTTGPDVPSHYEDFRPLIGRRQRLSIAENDPKILRLIQAHRESVPSQVVIPSEPVDFFDLVGQVLSKTTTYRAYLDADFCRTFPVLCNEGMLDRLWETSKALSHWLNDIWLTFTFSLDTRACKWHPTPAMMVKTLNQHWYRGVLVPVVPPWSYRDGANMVTMLLKAS